MKQGPLPYPAHQAQIIEFGTPELSDLTTDAQFFLLLPWGLQWVARLCIESTSVLLGWTGVLGRSVGDELELSAPTKEMEVIFFLFFVSNLHSHFQ